MPKRERLEKGGEGLGHRWRISANLPVNRKRREDHQSGLILNWYTQCVEMIFKKSLKHFMTFVGLKCMPYGFR